jgi:hypothetical protein
MTGALTGVDAVYNCSKQEQVITTRILSTRISMGYGLEAMKRGCCYTIRT